MSMQDPIADMFTRIRNALTVGKQTVFVPMSQFKYNIAKVLKDEGYIADFRLAKNEVGREHLQIDLKYYEGQSVITKIVRVSRPGLRIYKEKRQIPVVKNGLGIAIISTSKGVMSDRQARKMAAGGEVIGYVD